MDDDITRQPLAQALLRHLAATRGRNDALGSFARTVISGEASLRAAADFPWHSEALAAAATTAQDEQHRMPAEQRGRYERDAENLRSDPRIDPGEDQR